MDIIKTYNFLLLDRSVACEMCSKVVSCKKTLKSHVKKMHNGDPEVLSKIKNMVEEPIIAKCKWTDCDIEMDQRKIGDHILAHQRKEKQYDIISRPGNVNGSFTHFYGSISKSVNVIFYFFYFQTGV